MKVEQMVWLLKTGWQKTSSSLPESLKPSIIIIFAATDLLTDQKEIMGELMQRYSGVPIIGCASGSELWDETVAENSVVATVIAFETSKVHTAKFHIDNVSDSCHGGVELIRQLPSEGLKHVFVLSDALKIDATKLVEGIIQVIPPGVGVTGGLASDGVRLQKTPIFYNGEVEEGSAVAVGFYGENLQIQFACEAGWTPYGPERIANKTKDNVLYELDGQPALKLYKDILGPFANRLPTIGLLYPLSVRTGLTQKPLSRTIVAVNEEEQSITLAGGMPEGCYTRFMMTNVASLIKGAVSAANISSNGIDPSNPPELAFLLSCYARKQVLKQRVEEEVEAIRDIFGDKTIFAGFYCYGEIAPSGVHDQCSLQNQTMAITTFTEK